MSSTFLIAGVQQVSCLWWMNTQGWLAVPCHLVVPPHAVTGVPAWLIPPRATSVAAQRASGASGVRSAK